jgi:SanA protein
MRKRKKFLVTFIVILISGSALVFFCNQKIGTSARGKLYSGSSEIPYNRVGLLLGTAKYLRSGHLNPYYHYRIQAASELMKSGKISYLVISGDNSRKNYNEPQMMKTDLYQEGIDSMLIYLDYAGFRTFDSMVRLREIFSQDSVTIISQQFHNERALYIASKEGISAIAYNAKDVAKNRDLKVQFREKFARVKVFVDYMIGTKPKFLGPKVQIGQ